jgi:hypothetical protein
MTNHPNRSPAAQAQRLRFYSLMASIYPALDPAQYPHTLAAMWDDMTRLAPAVRNELMDAFERTHNHKALAKT